MMTVTSSSLLLLLSCGCVTSLYAVLFLLLILLVLLKFRPHFDILVSVYDERYDCQLVGDVSFGSIGMTRRDA